MTLARLSGCEVGYFAEVDGNNTVLRVISISNTVLGEPDLSFPATESKGQEFISDVLKFPGTWLQTSFNGTFRQRFAGINYQYDAVKNVFIAPQPFPSWVLDANNDWQPPVPCPGPGYIWDEGAGTWVQE